MRPTSGNGVAPRSAIDIDAIATRGAHGSVHVPKSPASAAATARARSGEPSGGRSSSSQIAKRPSSS